MAASACIPRRRQVGTLRKQKQQGKDDDDEFSYALEGGKREEGFHKQVRAAGWHTVIATADGRIRRPAQNIILPPARHSNVLVVPCWCVVCQGQKAALCEPTGCLWKGTVSHGSPGD
jgi:hypothetical protein